MTTLKAVLFDLDHTLIDWSAAEPWEDYQFRRLQTVFHYVRECLDPLDGADAAGFFTEYVTKLSLAWENAGQTLLPPDVRLVLAKTLRSFGVPVDRLDHDTLMDIYDWQPVEGERAFPDVKEVLVQLQSYGVDLGIVTNASLPMTYRDRELVAAGLLDLFPKCRVSAVDAGYLKPHRAIFEHALAVLDVQADEVVFVGDSLEADIKGAQGAGMLAVWRAPKDGPPDLSASEIVPDGRIGTLHDLLPLLDGWYPGWRNGR
jgi:HAD superfamily hydrolase (TIGR01549 family)